jgi:hypothetical protein
MRMTRRAMKLKMRTESSETVKKQEAQIDWHQQQSLWKPKKRKKGQGSKRRRRWWTTETQLNWMQAEWSRLRS